MPAVKVRIPASDRPFYDCDASLAHGVKRRLSEALQSLDSRGAPSPPSTSEPSDSVTIWISDAQEAALLSLGLAHGLSGLGPVASGILHAWAQESNDASASDESVLRHGANTTLARVNHALGDPVRLDQDRYYVGMLSAVMPASTTRRVIFAEASTGIGKTRAFLAVALDWMGSHPGETVVVAAPSYNVLLQSIVQWLRMQSASPADLVIPDCVVLVGQQEFVSEHALDAFLSDHPDVPGADLAATWLRSGGRASDDDPIGHRWLLRSLVAATHGVWAHAADVLLNGDASDTDGGMRAYRAQFALARDVPIVFCTHSMLAVHVRHLTLDAARLYSDSHKGVSVSDASWAQWKQLNDEDRRTSMTWELRNNLLSEQVTGDNGRLPPVGLLIVDEAHVLEQSFSQLFADGISVTRLLSTLRALRELHPKSIRFSDIEELERIRGVFSRVGSHTGGERIRVATNESLKEGVTALLTLVTEVLARLPGKSRSSPEARRLRVTKLALDVAAKSSGEKSGMRASVSWSPDLAWPSIEVGRYDVSRELDFLWSVVVRDCAIVVSATLYEDVSSAGLEGMRRILSVRSAYVRALTPVRPAWLYEPVTLCLAGASVHGDGLPRFRRPTKRDHFDKTRFAEQLERWRYDVATYVAQAHASAAGGVLVLMTAHDERKEVSTLLEAMLPPGCLLVQTPGTPLERIRRDYLELAASDVRPCLLAVGAAWTGLDLSGDALSAQTGRPISARDDCVFTDLIIPTAPIGLNRTLTHEWRRERSGMIAEVTSTCFLFRQGIGRLVRRDGLPHNRRLHFLDSRIHEREWAFLLSPVRRILEAYARRVTV